MNFKNYLKERGYSENTIKAYVYHAKKFGEYIKNYEELLLAKKIVYSCVSKYKPGTIRVVLSTLELLCEFSKISMDSNFRKNIRLREMPMFMDTLTKKEFEKVLINECERTKNIRERNTLLLSFLYYSGVRVSELLNLKKANFKNGYISIVGKGEKFRNIIVPMKLFDLCLSQPHEIIFSKINGQKLTAKAVNKIIKNRLEFSDIKKEITAHSFRRTYCTNLVRNGANIKIVSILMGHSRIETTAKYMHFNKDDIVKEYSKYMK